MGRAALADVCAGLALSRAPVPLPAARGHPAEAPPTRWMGIRCGRIGVFRSTLRRAITSGENAGGTWIVASGDLRFCAVGLGRSGGCAHARVNCSELGARERALREVADRMGCEIV